MKIQPPSETVYTFFLVWTLLASSQMLSPFAFLAACLFLGYIVFSQNSPISSWYVFIAFALIIIAFSGLIFNFKFEVAGRIFITCVLIPLVAAIDVRKHTRSLDLVSKLIAISIALGFLGFTYALLGGPDLFRVSNPDGRELLLFLSTFSNSNFPAGAGYIIRPSFIFDEPGAYTFAIDTFLLLNFMVYKRIRRLDWFLIIGGLITFSVAHILVCCLLVIAARKSKLLVIPAIAIVGADYLLFLASGVSQIIDRFTIVDGALAGDNRSELFQRAIQLVVDHPTGTGTSCNWDIAACIDLYGAFGENPVFPAAYYGLTASAAYYFILLVVGGIGFFNLMRLNRRLVFISLAIIALFAQRPFLFNLGYNLQILLVFSMLLRTVVFQFPKVINYSCQTSSL